MRLEEAQERVDAWISRFEEGYWPPLVNLARLIEEVGELAREMNHRFGEKTKRPDEPDADLAEELGDVLFVLIALANEQGIHLEEALTRVLEKYRVRDADRWTQRSDLPASGGESSPVASDPSTLEADSSTGPGGSSSTVGGESRDAGPSRDRTGGERCPES